MTYDSTSRLTTTPSDPAGFERAERLQQLGIGIEHPESNFDEFARDIARIIGAPYAMVNFIDEHRQFFAGIHTHVGGSETPQPDLSTSSDIGRVMDRDHGYCPYVVARKKALVLDDVCDYPRFAGNAVVDGLGVRSYLGAPLVDQRTNTTLGTVCVVDTKPRVWGRPGLELIKHQADEVMRVIERHT